MARRSGQRRLPGRYSPRRQPRPLRPSSRSADRALHPLLPRPPGRRCRIQSFQPHGPSRLETDPLRDHASMPTRDVTESAVDRWARGREALRAADPRMAELVDADPGLDPDVLFAAWPSDLWGAL